MATNQTRSLVLIVAGIPLALLGAIWAVAGATHTVSNTFTGAPIHHTQWAGVILGGLMFGAGLVMALVGSIGAAQRAA